MAGIDVESDTSFGIRAPQGVTPQSAPDITDGGVGLWGAAFRQTNSLVSSLQATRNSGPFNPVADYNPINDIKGWDEQKYRVDHGEKFVGSRSPAETRAIMAQIDQEENDKRLLSANGGYGFIAQGVAGFLDPTIFMPAGVAFDSVKGGLTFGRAAVRTGAAGLLQSSMQEAMLHTSQQTHTFEEGALNVASGTILSALIGGGAAALLSRGERAALTAKLHAERAELNAHAGNPASPEAIPTTVEVGGKVYEGPDRAAAIAAAEADIGRKVDPAEVSSVAEPPVGDSTALPMAAGAAASDTRQVELVDFGLNRIPVLGKLIEKSSPMQRLFGASAASVRRAAADLAETSLLTKENLEGGVTTAGPALDREARMHINQAQVAVGDSLTSFYSEYRFGEQKRAPRIQAAWDDLLGRRADGVLTFDEFKEAVSDALRNGDRHDIEQVTAAAQVIRQKVFEPWKKRAIEAGLLPEDVSTATADSYLQRVYNKQKIAADRPAWVNRVTDWLEGDQTVKRQAQQRIGDLKGQLDSATDRIDRHESRLETLSGQIDRLGARLDEKAMDVSRATRRDDVLVERAASIAEEIRDTKAFIAEARADLRDPEMLRRLDELERDANALEKLDKPVTEKDLQKIEEQELKGILTGPIRKAAEMLTGRRKFPKPPSFIEWIIRQGGIKTDDPNIGDVLVSIDKSNKFRIARKNGLTLDQIAEKLPEEFPDYAGLGDEILSPEEAQISGGGHRTASRAQVLQYIDDAAHGHEPGWLLSGMRSTDDVEAAQYAAMLDEVFTRAGVEVKTPRDVAAVLAGNKRFGVTLADLDRIAAEMEAAGESIPLTMRTADRQEQVVVARTQVQALRERIAKGIEARDKAQRRLDIADARLEENQVNERSVRGRLGVLQERMNLAERRRELNEDWLALAHQNRDEVLGKIEKEIGAWEGKSTREAKAALKAREKAEKLREDAKARGAYQGKGERLTSADNAIEKAVDRIIKSDRDLPRTELEARAQEITDRIIGSPDGRLPYDLDMSHGEGGPASDARGPLAARQFNIPDKLIADYLENDIEHVVGTHLSTMVPDVMLTEKFGDVNMTEGFRKINEEYAALAQAATSATERTALEGERQAAIRDLAAVRDRIRGTFGIPATAPLRNAARAVAVIKNYNVLTSMGAATISSLPDMAGVVMRHGFENAFRDAWIPFFKMLTHHSDAWKEAARQYRAMGIAVESTLAARHRAMTDILDTYHPQSRVERTMQWASNKFQFVNMLAPWTDFAKINASIVGGSEILRAARAVVEGKATGRQRRMLGESGIEPHMAERIYKAFQTGGEVRDGVHLPNTTDWADLEARRVFEGAVGREADISVVTPGQEKPLIMSDPILSIVGQFKSFTAAATERVMIANLQRRDAQVLQGIIFSMGLGMLSYKINSLTGGTKTSDRPQDWIKEGISRSSMLGWFEEGNALASKATRGGVDLYRLIGADKPLTRFASRSAMDQILGPTAGKVQAVLGTMGAATHPSQWSEADTKALRRLIAGQNVFWLRNAFDAVEHGANNAFGIPMKGQSENR